MFMYVLNIVGMRGHIYAHRYHSSPASAPVSPAKVFLPITDEYVFVPDN